MNEFAKLDKARKRYHPLTSLPLSEQKLHVLQGAANVSGQEIFFKFHGISPPTWFQLFPEQVRNTWKPYGQFRYSHEFTSASTGFPKLSTIFLTELHLRNDHIEFWIQTRWVGRSRSDMVSVTWAAALWSNLTMSLINNTNNYNNLIILSDNSPYVTLEDPSH